MSLLQVDDLSVSVKANRAKVPILRNVNLEVNKSEVVAVVGETGSGKTLTARAIKGILPKNSIIDSGHIFYEGVDLFSRSSDARSRRNKISMVFQNPMSSLHPLFKISSQMYDVLDWSGVEHSKMTREARLDRISSKMEQVNLEQKVLDMYSFQLSGGMRQRVMIAMALLCEPELLIADEPTTALDVTTQREILSLLQELVTKNNMSLLLITHNLGIAFETAKRTYVFYAGRVVEEGLTSSLFRTSLHPYTQGLISSIPSLDRSRAMVGIPGEISQDDRSSASCCCFRKRCPLAIDVCFSKEPTLDELESRHRVACFVASNKGVIRQTQ